MIPSLCCGNRQEEIPAITYNSGGTYTLGALMQAVEVLQVEDYRLLSGHGDKLD